MATLCAGGVVAGGAPAAVAACNTTDSDAPRLNVSRVLEVDTSGGPVLGKMTRLPHEPQFLLPGEVVLTFDDGPMPWITRAILDTLDQHCTRATFFSVGKMAVAYPSVVREVIARGHTVGTHTWSHPLNLKRLKGDAATLEMEKGFAAVATAAGQAIAPFFRFPGLSDSPELMAHLARRQVASVTVDVVSNDSFITDPQRLIRETLAKVDTNRGGILLFHDIKPATARALPEILHTLAVRGYKVVHLVPKLALAPRHDLVASFEPQVAKILGERGRAKTALMPFFGTVGPERVTEVDAAEPMSARDAAREDTKLEEAPVDVAGADAQGGRSGRPGVREWVRPSAEWTSSIRRTFAD